MRRYTVDIQTHQKGQNSMPIFGGTVIGSDLGSALGKVIRAFEKEWREKGNRIDRGSNFTIRIIAGDKVRGAEND